MSEPKPGSHDNYSEHILNVTRHIRSFIDQQLVGSFPDLKFEIASNPTSDASLTHVSVKIEGANGQHVDLATDWMLRKLKELNGTLSNKSQLVEDEIDKSYFRTAYAAFE